MLVLCGDGPRAVGVIGVAIREPGALNCPVGTLQLERAVLTWEREREEVSGPEEFLEASTEMGTMFTRFPTGFLGCPRLGTEGEKDG